MAPLRRAALASAVLVGLLALAPADASPLPPELPPALLGTEATGEEASPVITSPGAADRARPMPAPVRKKLVYNQGWYDNVIAVDPADANRVWVGGRRCR